MSAPRLGYVVRFVGSLSTSVDFYRDVLGLRPSKQAGHWAQFECGSIRLGLYERAAMAETLGVGAGELGSPPGAFELAFEVDDVDRAYRAAIDAGAGAFREPADRAWGERTAYVLDPDGALIELYRRSSQPRRLVLDTVEGESDDGEDVRRREMARPSSDPGAGLPDPNA